MGPGPISPSGSTDSADNIDSANKAVESQGKIINTDVEASVIGEEEIFYEDEDTYDERRGISKKTEDSIQEEQEAQINRQTSEFQKLPSLEEKIGIRVENRSEVALEKDLKLYGEGNDSELAKNAGQQIILVNTVVDQFIDDSRRASESVRDEPERYESYIVYETKGRKTKVVDLNPSIGDIIKDAEVKSESTLENQYDMDRETYQWDESEDSSSENS
jgi:hypothetical protein